ncbi:transcription termination factor NusG [Pectobacterium aroidearum]|uniref:transcription termination factor NusG n=1 Tax=Pectobacterium aroidearum TaxID=1201031 RepID=UPI003158229C
MNIEDISNQQWYLALYITGGKNRESLFGWLNDRQMIPWTPLTITKIKRSDAPNAYRKRISAVFPGYFFLKANFEYHTVDMVRSHSAFCDFVKFGSKLTPIEHSVVQGLMKKYPDPTLHPAAQGELEAASEIWLTKSQYRFLTQLDKTEQPISRTAMLFDLIRHSDSYGF